MSHGNHVLSTPLVLVLVVVFKSVHMSKEVFSLMLSSLRFMDHCEISGILIWSECIHAKSCYYVPWSISGKRNWKPLVLSAFRATTMFTFLALHQAGSLGLPQAYASLVCDTCRQDTSATPWAWRVALFAILWWHLCCFVILFFWLHWSVTLTATLLGPAVKWFGMTSFLVHLVLNCCNPGSNKLTRPRGKHPSWACEAWGSLPEKIQNVYQIKRCSNVKLNRAGV